jgi:hypothetical protein
MVTKLVALRDVGTPDDCQNLRLPKLPTNQPKNTKEVAASQPIPDTSGISNCSKASLHLCHSFTQSSHGLAWALMNNHLSTWCIPLNSTTYLLTQDQMEMEFEPSELISFKSNVIASDLRQVRVLMMLTLIFSLSKAILSMWFQTTNVSWLQMYRVSSTIHPRFDPPL